MTSYNIELSYYDAGGVLYAETYNVAESDVPSALKCAIDRFHKDRRPIRFTIHRYVIEPEYLFER